MIDLTDTDGEMEQANMKKEQQPISHHQSDTKNHTSQKIAPQGALSSS